MFFTRSFTAMAAFSSPSSSTASALASASVECWIVTMLYMERAILMGL